MEQKWGLMSQKEAQRLSVVERVDSGELSQTQAAVALGISVRQIKRLCRRVREQGPAGLISRKRGVPSNRRIGTEQRERYMALVHQHYPDFGPELACEYLAREHGFGYSIETLRGDRKSTRLNSSHG